MYPGAHLAVTTFRDPLGARGLGPAAAGYKADAAQIDESTPANLPLREEYPCHVGSSGGFSLPKCRRRVCVPASASICKVFSSFHDTCKRPGPLHHSHRAVSFALLAVGDVLVRVPCQGDLARLGVDWQISDVAFLRRDAEAPLIHNLRDPIACKIDRRGSLRRFRSGRWAGRGQAPERRSKSRNDAHAFLAPR